MFYEIHVANSEEQDFFDVFNSKVQIPEVAATTCNRSPGPGVFKIHQIILHRDGVSEAARGPSYSSAATAIPRDPAF